MLSKARRLAVVSLPSKGIALIKNFAAPVGVGGRAKGNAPFDIGSERPPVCRVQVHTCELKRQYASAKMKVWNEAMYYFLSPDIYRKILLS